MGIKKLAPSVRYPCLAQWALHAASSPLEVSLVRWLFVVLGERTLWSLGCLPALLAMGYTSAPSQGLRRSWILARDGLWPRGNSTRMVCWEAPWPSPVRATKPAMLTAPGFVRPVQCVSLVRHGSWSKVAQLSVQTPVGEKQENHTVRSQHSITSSDGCKLKSVFFVRNWNEGSAYKFLQL